MPELIPVTMHHVGTETVQTVNARDLHAFLHVKARFNDWITRRIETYGFVQGIDFIHYSDLSNDLPVPSVEYYLSLNMAKELSMVERTAKGKEARLYFLACEKAAQSSQAVPQVKNPAHQLLIDTVVRLDAVEQQALAAEQRAEQANANALRALETQLFFTVAEYVYLNHLGHQIPEDAYRACSDHLRTYCLDHAIPFRRTAVGGKRWDDEYSFHTNVYTEALPGWLKRRFAQTHFQVLRLTPERPEQS